MSAGQVTRRRCTIGEACRRHYGAVHGHEAEELRAGVETLMRMASSRNRASVTVAQLQRLLDSVDARDSLAFIEAEDARKKRRLGRKPPCDPTEDHNHPADCADGET